MLPRSPLILLAFFVYEEMEKALEMEIREGTSKEMIQMDHAIGTMLNGMKEDCQYLAINLFIEMADTVDTFYNTQQKIVPPSNDSVHEGGDRFVVLKMKKCMWAFVSRTI